MYFSSRGRGPRANARFRRYVDAPEQPRRFRWQRPTGRSTLNPGCISEGQPFSHQLARRLPGTGRSKHHRASGFGSCTNKEKEAFAMIKTKIVALALALTGLASCEMADRSNLFDQDYYKLGVGGAPKHNPSVPIPSRTAPASSSRWG